MAAGSARRMAGVDKIMADLGGEPLFGSDGPGLSGDGSCETNRHCHSSEFDRTGLRRREAAGFSKVKAVITGGDTRQASVQLGLAALSGGASGGGAGRGPAR